MMVRDSISPMLLELIRDEPIDRFCLLDVGCGSGALTFALAGECKFVLGIDILEDRIEEAKRYAASNDIDNVSFRVGDAYSLDYRSLGRIDVVVSNLCMSDEIILRSFDALDVGHPLVFACFHSDNLKELGRRSRFSYSESELKDVLFRTGFSVEFLKVDMDEICFDSKKEALDYFDDSMKSRWGRDGRLNSFLSYLDKGGRSVTFSRLIVKARK